MYEITRFLTTSHPFTEKLKDREEGSERYISRFFISYNRTLLQSQLAA